MRSHRESTRSGGALAAEGLLFLLFALLLVRLYLAQARTHTTQVHWWTWPAVAAPFFLGLLVEWRRKKPPLLSRERLITTRREHVLRSRSHHGASAGRYDS